MFEIFKVIITPSITIIGFIINIVLTRSDLKKQLSKKKSEITLEKLSEVPLEILDLLNSIFEKKKDILDKFKKLTSKIFAYGSEDAIKILATMQQYLYNKDKYDEDDDKYLIICYNILLLCQVRYDLTGIKISPEYWYKMRLTDYNVMSQNLIKSTNTIVEFLNLEEFLMIRKASA